MNNEAMFSEIMGSFAEYGSLKESALAHGIDNINMLFPDPKTLSNEPIFIRRRTEWADYFIKNVAKRPFSKIKTIFTDITKEEARAKGYIKGNKKTEEVINALRRITEPTTIYKKQKLDRDDITDITDFNVVSWLQEEMKIILQEEIARACLVGDGRSSSDPDKISERNIRPIFKDESTYLIKDRTTPKESDFDTDNDLALFFIDKILELQQEYRGSGNLVLFINRQMLVKCLTVRDKIGRRIYKNVSELLGAMNIPMLIPVEIFNIPVYYPTTDKSILPLGIAFDPNDYVIGSVDNGAITSFSDFDIDYNQQIYLMETRLSGALVRPYSAIRIGLELNK